MQPIRLGIIGSGIAARELHLPALRKLKDEFKIVAVCSRHVEKARAFARMIGRDVEVERNARALLARDDIEAVDIATPIMLNAPTAIAALKAGKHVFLEKPVCVDMHEGRRLAAVARESGLVAMAGENMRYRAVLARAESLVKKGRIGRLSSFTWISQYCVASDNKYAQTTWRRHHVYPGGFIFDGGVHNIAVIRRLAGEIMKVNARTTSINRELGKIDGLFMEMELAGDVRGALSIQLSAPVGLVDYLTLVGTRGIIMLSEDTLLFSTDTSPRREEVILDDGGFRAEFEDFHRAVTRGLAPRSTLAEGMADVAVVLAAIHSAHTGRSVNV